MIIEPMIEGVVARTAHPTGCEHSVIKQIEYSQQATPIKCGPKRVLIIGGSSGLGLAARIALTFGGANADTISVSYERGPSSRSVGSAGYFNDIFFQKHAQKSGRVAINIQGDAFLPQTKAEVIEAIETYFEGEVDLIIYSLASGVRPKPNSDDMWRSTIKPIGQDVSGSSVSLETDQWVETSLHSASEEETEATLKVMGGEDWENWIDALINAESIAEGCKTIAFSYIGPESTHAIYLDGTLGRAKIDLHQTSHALNLKMANFSGGAYATVCKALVTKASVFIPGLTPYILALYRVMKQEGTHEGCIEQMQRLFREKLYSGSLIPLDSERLIRMDDWELSPAIQSQVSVLLEKMNSQNFKELGDYAGFKQEFLNINGFGFSEIDYTKPVDLSDFTR
ncbi:trans-2-enoyl-CoA reductase family protein [Vibrio sp. Isolate23]|uniref:enoyl-ACP reductase FabV n=1 Tax=Vibrio sp. Isolate23 TaxID=2908533 RepID=UPI001EFCD9EC|nr:enoyl-ACP reductase FabV [Vibrio sp. Isolate23]MCG9682245.1 trans-2-enoyl-CoA reductase family protein [Vibrio sp. Isolate23]